MRECQGFLLKCTVNEGYGSRRLVIGCHVCSKSCIWLLVAAVIFSMDIYIYSVSRSVQGVMFSFLRVFQFSKTGFLAMIKEIRMVLVKWLGTMPGLILHELQQMVQALL